MLGQQWHLKTLLFFPIFILCFIFFISIPNVQFIPQFINVIATNNNLLTDELNIIYFAPKLWLYVMIWLPRTTDNRHILLSPLKFEVSRVDCILKFYTPENNKIISDFFFSFLLSGNYNRRVCKSNNKKILALGTHIHRTDHQSGL